MLERIVRCVEDAVAEPSLSRRAWLSTLARRAAVAASAIGVVLARPRNAAAHGNAQACAGICAQQCVSMPNDMQCFGTCMESCLG